MNYDYFVIAVACWFALSRGWLKLPRFKKAISMFQPCRNPGVSRSTVNGLPARFSGTNKNLENIGRKFLLSETNNGNYVLSLNLDREKAIEMMSQDLISKQLEVSHLAVKLRAVLNGGNTPEDLKEPAGWCVRIAGTTPPMYIQGIEILPPYFGCIKPLLFLFEEANDQKVLALLTQSEIDTIKVNSSVPGWAKSEDEKILATLFEQNKSTDAVVEYIDVLEAALKECRNIRASI